MWLTEIEADRVRNLRSVNVQPAGGLTVILGRNGQGKTSLLEAVYLLATGRSFRTRKIEEVVSRAGGPLRVAGSVAWRGGDIRLGCVKDNAGRRLLVNGRVRPLDGFLGRLDLVAVAEERMSVLREGPVERRRFLDRGVAGINPAYLKDIGEYRRTLAQRNALLRREMRAGRGPAAREIEAWDGHLARAAERIHRSRREYATRLAARMAEAARTFFADGEELRVRYLPSPAATGREEAGCFRRVFLEALERLRDRDLDLGFTGVGPHRDDFVVELDGMDLRKYGSAGQARAAVIALKVAKLSLLREERLEPPVFLMDDFDTDLDEERASALARFLHEGRFQSMVATSKEGLVERLGVPFRMIRMEDGAARAG